MNYVHIPVEWDAPTTPQFDFFADVMESLDGERVWVHCMVNMRVTVFVYLYRVLRRGVDRETAWRDVTAVWQPNDTWSAFIAEVSTP